MPIAETRWVELSARPGSGRALLEQYRAVRARGFLSKEAAGAAVARIYESQRHWNADFGGEQFSLGRAWYTHLEEERTREYFRCATESNALVERVIPGLAAKLVDAVALVTGEPASVREGWCGPGVHVFPLDEHVGREGGVVHFDTEGLAEPHAAARAPAITVVLMLQPADEGGGLAVWDAMYEGEDGVDDDELADLACDFVEYESGDIVVLDSYRLHQIQAFGGRHDRVSMTAHAARVGARWDVWF